MYLLKLGRIITLDPRVLTPNLDGFIPRSKTKWIEGAFSGLYGLACGLHAGGEGA